MERYRENRADDPYPLAIIAAKGKGSGPDRPECFATIQSGDFVKAKEICRAPNPILISHHISRQTGQAQQRPGPGRGTIQGIN